jgi:O-antigen ligase
VSECDTYFLWKKEVLDLNLCSNTGKDAHYPHPFLLFWAFFTASGDLFWVFSLGGTVRLSLLVFLVVFSLLVLSRKLVLPKSSVSFFIWVSFLALFMFNGEPLLRSVSYWFFLIASFAVTVSIYSLMRFYSPTHIIRLYIQSFACVAAFGVIQFILGILGVEVLVSQYWLVGLPRVNGFSYEPSYFFTYMLPCWIVLFILRQELPRNLLLRRRFINLSLALVSVSLALTFSRMGYLCIFVFVVAYYFFELLNQIRRGWLNRKKVTTLVIMSCLIFFSAIYTIQNVSSVLRGIEIDNLKESHSSGPRIVAAFEELEAFINRPLVGYGIGGIPSARAHVRGELINSIEDSKKLEGSVVFLEVLVASGVVGFIFFLILIFYPLIRIQNIRKRVGPHTSTILKSFQYAFIFTLLILQFNQNINRVYFWEIFGFILAFSSPKIVKNLEDSLK